MSLSDKGTFRGHPSRLSTATTHSGLMCFFVGPESAWFTPGPSPADGISQAGIFVPLNILVHRNDPVVK